MFWQNIPKANYKSPNRFYYKMYGSTDIILHSQVKGFLFRLAF